uniref:FRAS1-related extracellular matrix protein 1 n=1 Tax=Angiostrongylus cantonensis TaxID=6313 RepID=A0A0K0DKJ2_ANGCA
MAATTGVMAVLTRELDINLTYSCIELRITQRSVVSDKVPNLEKEVFLFPPDYEEATNNEPKIVLSKDCEQSETRDATFVGQKNASLVVTDVNKQLYLHV